MALLLLVGLAFSPHPSANSVGVEGEVECLCSFKKKAIVTTVLCSAFLLMTGPALAAQVTVSKNDTLWAIAKKHGTSVETLKKLNKLTSDLIHPGQVLALPDKQSETATRREAAPAEQVSRGTLDRVDDLLEFAKTLLGKKYRAGGETPDGFDCSGYVRYVFKHFGINLVHSSAEQFESAGAFVEKEDLQAGDLVFFSRNSKSIGHVGIYMGDNKFIHAASPGKGVIISGMDETYYNERYKGAKRIIAE